MRKGLIGVLVALGLGVLSTHAVGAATTASDPGPILNGAGQPVTNGVLGQATRDATGTCVIPTGSDIGKVKRKAVPNHTTKVRVTVDADCVIHVEEVPR